MEKAQILQAINETPKGANIILAWERQAKTRKNVVDSIRKAVVMVGRIGIDYDEQVAVQRKRENGELPAVNNGLSWGEWEIFPFLIVHKGENYLRLYKGTSKTVKPSVQWLRNGEPVSFESVANDLLASEKAEKTGDCFTVKVADVIRIHHEVEQIPEPVTIEVDPIGQTENVSDEEPAPHPV